MADIQKLTGLVAKSQLSGIVSDLVTFIKGQDTNVTNAYKALVGELGNKSEAEGTEGEAGYKPAVAHTVKSYVDAAITAANGDITTLEGKVNTLIGDDVSKSARTIAAEEVAKVVAEAPEAFDTLKEIADWIGSGEDIQGTTAATMLADITKLKGNDTTEGSVAYAVKQAKDAILGNAATDTKDSKTIEGVLKYVDDKVGGKNVSAEGESGDAALVSASAADNKVTVASTQKLKDAVTRAEASVQSVTKATSTENYVAITVTDGDDATIAIDDSALNTKIGAAKNGETAASGMYADIQGATNATVAEVETAINGFALMTDADVAEIKALIV